MHETLSREVLLLVYLLVEAMRAITNAHYPLIEFLLDKMSINFNICYSIMLNRIMCNIDS